MQTRNCLLNTGVVPNVKLAISCFLKHTPDFWSI